MPEYNAGSRKDVRKAEKDARVQEIRHEAVLRNIMLSAEGRWWMFDLLERCHIGRTPYSPDALGTAFACGEQNIGLRLWADLQELCPDQYIQMMREYHARRNPTPERPSSPDDGGGDQGSGGDPADGDYDPIAGERPTD